jgi:hypothetical protein
VDPDPGVARRVNRSRSDAAAADRDPGTPVLVLGVLVVGWAVLSLPGLVAFVSVALGEVRWRCRIPRPN